MKTSELDYALPEELIAQAPAAKRDQSRLLVLNRADESIVEDVFAHLPRYLNAGDCVIVNDTKVIKARLRARKESGGRVEIFLLKELAPGHWEALMRPAARVKVGGEVVIEQSDVRATVEEALPDRRRVVRFSAPDVLAVLQRSGAVPLPPYIHRDAANGLDETRYQTVYAREPGAVAAPTAGLHFTDDVFAALDGRGVRRAAVTLHVGYGTFKPIQAEDLAEHRVDPETFRLSDATARLLNDTRAHGGRICAVGTTVTRVLESCIDGAFHAKSGETGHYIYPPYTFRAVDALVTNFHLPRSSLLALVCAFGGTEFVLRAYRYAVKERFRFYSYGDAMLIL